MLFPISPCREQVLSLLLSQESFLNKFWLVPSCHPSAQARENFSLFFPIPHSFRGKITKRHFNSPTATSIQQSQIPPFPSLCSLPLTFSYSFLIHPSQSSIFNRKSPIPAFVPPFVSRKRNLSPQGILLSPIPSPLTPLSICGFHLERGWG